MGDAGARIRAAIGDRGPITFAEFMGMALLGPGGFFEEPPVGPTGAFLTAPHVHAVFADLVRFALADLHEGLGRPAPFRVVDLGAGDGTLAAAIADGFRDLDGVPCEVEGVDASAGARDAMAARGLRSAARLVDLPPGDPAVVLGNEVLDNLPFRWVRRRADGFVEVRVDARGDAFVPVEAPCDPSLVELAGDLPDGADAFVSPDALAFVDDLAAWLRRGYVLLIDYGWPDRPAHEVHGYRDHRLVGEVLADPGSCDITAGVDFGAIARRATERGLVVLGEVRQDAALRTLGYDDWQSTQRERQTAARAGGDAVAELRIWEGRGLASILVDPERMGGFRWLLLGTPGLPAPTWG